MEKKKWKEKKILLFSMPVVMKKKKCENKKKRPKPIYNKQLRRWRRRWRYRNNEIYSIISSLNHYYTTTIDGQKKQWEFFTVTFNLTLNDYDFFLFCFVLLYPVHRLFSRYNNKSHRWCFLVQNKQTKTKWWLWWKLLLFSCIHHNNQRHYWQTNKQIREKKIQDESINFFPLCVCIWVFFATSNNIKFLLWSVLFVFL